ncbi:MAG: hypothetical protein CL581_15905 [Alteromonadaceae bacterium]|uniref:hypothetical protein n=1 Tax=unclassified Marinobacter TaxID=83889 RepID=UPI000C46DC3C|nr:hypothetical protein [Marinobacter sp. BGYM27]MAA66240.1 hypothetical protein [Alteromonadaceae bacterium]MBH87314.1 hypothetical protein [Alteromonadaceae bacterium]MDG5498987.1 hypothetical protein [Marinobacter sp. BGYM27]|tara:strand:- start:62883 stop:63137 length:255 start_codon:yes stop_codon:yes gene_type:complete
MARTRCQQALDRVMIYLQGYDIEPTQDVSRRALQLVDSVFAESDEKVIERAVDRIADYFDLPEPDLPEQRPPLKRGSIGYRPYV